MGPACDDAAAAAAASAVAPANGPNELLPALCVLLAFESREFASSNADAVGRLFRCLSSCI